MSDISEWARDLYNAAYDGRAELEWDDLPASERAVWIQKAEGLVDPINEIAIEAFRELFSGDLPD